MKKENRRRREGVKERLMEEGKKEEGRGRKE